MPYDIHDLRKKPKTEKTTKPLAADKTFDGKTYEPAYDFSRLNSQLARVFRLMADGRWRTLAEIRTLIQAGSEAGISARLRDLRKKRFGENEILSRRRGPAKRGLHEYRLILNKERPA